MRCRRFTVSEARILRRLVRIPASVSDAEFRQGLDVELEHRDVTYCDRLLTAKIAAAHLRERPDYYTRLARYVER